MRAIRVATAVLLGAGALALTAPTAAQAREDITPFGFAVEPSTIAAGGRVTLRVERGEGCRGPVRVTSGVFDPVVVPPHTSTATAAVDRGARPGAVYQVMFVCDGASGSTSLTIAGGAPGEHTPHPVPRHGAHAGGGGTVAGFDLRELGLGVLLVAGSVGTAYHLSRRRESP